MNCHLEFEHFLKERTKIIMFASFWNELSFQPSSKRGRRGRAVEKGSPPKLQGHLSLAANSAENPKATLSVGT